MGIHKNSNGCGSVQDTRTFGNQATGLSSGFGQQSNTVFGTFANQNKQGTNSSTTSTGLFGSQQTYGNNYFQNPGYFQPYTFGFGRTMSHQTTNICFTGFGEAKTNYCFASTSSACMKKVTLVFEHPDTIFGSSMFKKPNTIVEIEAHPTKNNWPLAASYNDFSFTVGHIEKYNSIFVMKSTKPIKFLIKVKQSAGLNYNNTMSNFYGDRKITLTFQSDQQQFIPNTNIPRPVETIVEIPLTFTRNDPIGSFSSEDFMFSVGPNGASNSLEVQTSKNAVFRVTFADTAGYNNNQLFGNRQTRTGSVYFDQGRQMNAFPTTNGSLFGNAPAFGTSHLFGNSTSGATSSFSNQPHQMNSAQRINGGSTLFGKPSAGGSFGFGSSQEFGNSTTGIAAGAQSFNTSQPPMNAGGSVFGGQASGNNGLGSLFGSSKAENVSQGQQMNDFPTTWGSLSHSHPTFSGGPDESYGFGANQSFTNPTTFNDKTHEMTNLQNAGGSLFGQASNCMNNQQQTFGFANDGASDVSFCNSHAGNSATYFDQGQQMHTAPFNQCSSLFNQPTIAGNGNHGEAFTFGTQPKTFSNGSSIKYQPTLGSDYLTNQDTSVNTKTNCITAMREYANKSLEELRFDEYLRNHGRQPSAQGGMTTNFNDRQDQIAHSNPNTFAVHSPSHNNIIGGNTNQAFFEQLHKLMPYLNAGSFCKCNRSSNAFKNQNAAAGSALTNNRSSRTNSDSLDRLYGKTQKPRLNENRTIDEFYEDVFKYLEYIQKQYRHLESTLINKNANTKDHERSKNSTTLRAKEAKRISSQHMHKSPAPVFGSSTNSIENPATKEKSSLPIENSEKNNTEMASGSISFPLTVPEVLTDSTTEATNNIVNEEPKKISLFGSSVSTNIVPSPSKPLDAALGVPLNSKLSFLLPVASGNSDDAIKTKETTNTQDHSNTSATHKAEELNKITTQNAAENNPLSVLNKNQPCEQFSSIFGSYASPVTLPTVFSLSTPTNGTKNEESNKIPIFGFDVGSKIASSTSKQLETSATTTEHNFRCAFVTSYDAAINKRTKELEDQSNRNKTEKISGDVSSKSESAFISPFGSTKTTTGMVDKKLTEPFSFSSVFTGPSPSANTCSPFGTSRELFSVIKNSSYDPDNKRIFPLFSTQGAVEERTDKANNILNSDMAEPKANESSGKENLQKETNPHIDGTLISKSFTLNDKKNQTGSYEQKNTQENNEPMDVQYGYVFPYFQASRGRALNMKKISDELASLEANECEDEGKRKVSLSKSDDDSDISNYSLISNRSSNEYDKENTSSVQTEDPTGIKMTRFGYYIKPSLEDLKSLITDDGACIVPRFTIGRKGYGRICFDKDINVAGLNIDEIVHFRNKEIIMYPNGNAKSTVVSYLESYDVLVTLEQVWPLDKTTHEPIKDPHHLDKIKYEDKLRLACQKNDAHFVEYRAETGSWLFKLNMKQLFTKNNINCWNEEDADVPENECSTSTGTPQTIKLKHTDIDKTEEQGPPVKKIFF